MNLFGYWTAFFWPVTKVCPDVKITVEVREDHLEFLARAKPLAALAELIWNALDAESTEVRVEYVENDLGGVEVLRIRDNGHGLHPDHAQVVFRNLGGSWKQGEVRSSNRKRMLHGKYGKGRFRGFTLGNHVQWISNFSQDGQLFRYSVTGHAQNPGEFELSDPMPVPPLPHSPIVNSGMTVEIRDLPATIDGLRGGKALQDVTELFAPYLRLYPDVKINYDGVPLDPANAETNSTSYDLGELVMVNGERVKAELTVIEWSTTGQRGVIPCDANGFALAPPLRRYQFRGFSYTAYLKSAHFEALEREGLIEAEGLCPDIPKMMDAARTVLRQHFGRRVAEKTEDLLRSWRDSGLYPYEAAPANEDEARKRKVFDLYAVHINQSASFSETSAANKRLVFRLLREIVEVDAKRAPRILDDFLSFGPEKDKEVTNLLGE
jgi:hypothetical protein